MPGPLHMVQNLLWHRIMICLNSSDLYTLSVSILASNNDLSECLGPFIYVFTYILTSNNDLSECLRPLHMVFTYGPESILASNNDLSECLGPLHMVLYGILMCVTMSAIY